MANHSSLEIANEFLARAGEEKRALTHMQLQKLVYLAHGWNLAVNGEPLIEDDIEAWEFGPVIRKLYDALKQHGRGTVKRRICWGDDTPFPSDDDDLAVARLHKTERAVIDKVWDTYKGYQAFQLSALTHAEGSPWDRAYAKGRNRVIEDSSIREYFVRLGRPRDAA